MRRPIATLSLMFALLGGLVIGVSNQVSAEDKAGAKWHHKYEAAVELAKKEKKLLLVDFTGSDWCGWCIRLKKEVFDKPEFKEWAAKNVVLLELDFPRGKKQDEATKAQNRKLAKKYGIRGFPTILFLDAEGKVVGRSGYKRGGPAKWTEHADKIIAKWKSGS